METCLRGFSFMPSVENTPLDLQIIEQDELDQTWRATRRQRIKEQEQSIWKKFVQEKDVVKSVEKENPYQFLTDLPESCLKELLELELEKLRQDRQEELETEQRQQQQLECSEEQLIEEPPEQKDVQMQDVELIPSKSKTNVHKQEAEYDDDDAILHILYDESDGPEPEAVSEKSDFHESVHEEESPPCTVREVVLKSTKSSKSVGKMSHKSSENISSILESSIYCARIKDLRIKICDETIAVCTSLECQNISMLDLSEILKIKKRSIEFAARFNRIHLYQVQRQIHDIKRHNVLALPFAKYTHFQSQIVRISSLHQTMLQTLSVFHKSIEQTLCLPPAGDVLKSVLQTFKLANEVCQSVPVPSKCDADQTLFNDNLIESCVTLSAAADHYTHAVTSYLDNTCTNKTKKPKKKVFKPHNSNIIVKQTQKSESDPRLAMYSVESLRLPLSSKPAKEVQSSVRQNFRRQGPHSSRRAALVHDFDKSATSRIRESEAKKREAKPDSQRTPKKSTRRPLMRGPPTSRPTRDKPHKESEIHTMVENVEMVQTPHEPSPETSAKPSPRFFLGLSPRPARSPAPRSPAPRSPAPRIPRSVLTSSNIRLPRITHSNDSRKPPNDALNLNLRLKLNSAQIDPEDGKRSAFNSHRSHHDGVKSAGDPEQKTNKEKRITNDNGDAKKKKERCFTKAKVTESSSVQSEVTRLVKELCGGDSSTKTERPIGTKNAQLLCIKSIGSPRQPSTPQLLRILEETIQKKVPKGLVRKLPQPPSVEKFRLPLNINEESSQRFFKYRTKFVQHMLTSPLYANTSITKPWQMIASISEKIIDDLLLGCSKEMQLEDFVTEMYKVETQ